MESSVNINIKPVAPAFNDDDDDGSRTLLDVGILLFPEELRLIQTAAQLCDMSVEEFIEDAAANAASAVLAD